VRAFRDGATAEAIVQRYPSLGLADVYATIAHALGDPARIDDYLAKRESEAGEIQRKIESHQGDLAEIRSRLLARPRT
jgi:hypothetical protein